MTLSVLWVIKMYLSQIEIDFNNRQKARDLTHVGAFHNWVEQSFPDEVNSGNRSRKLWRIDPLNNKQYLLIVSQIKPDIESLEKYGVKGTGKILQYDKFLNSLEEGLKTKFRVTLNPVKSVSKPEQESKRGRVFPVLSVSDQMDFLLSRCEKNGFAINDDECYIVDRGFVNLKRVNEKMLKLSRVTYEGNLTIKDKEQFIKTLTEGFGKKKAYGFGMMTIIPER